MELKRAEFLVSDDPARLDVDVIHAFLRQSYWAAGIPREIVERSIQGSLCFGVYDGETQVAFARCVTDRATYAYVADVFVLPSHRGRKLARLLMDAICAHPDLQGLRRWGLVTKDAHGLYAQYGFTSPKDPDRHMEKLDPEIYARKA